MVVGNPLGRPGRADVVLARPDDLHQPHFLRVGNRQRLALVAPAVLLDQLAADADGLAGGLCPFEHQPGQVVAVDQPLLADQLLPAAKGRFADGQLMLVHDAVDAGDVAERLGHLRDLADRLASVRFIGPVVSASQRVNSTWSPGLCFSAGTIDQVRAVVVAVAGVRSHHRSVGRRLAADHDRRATLGLCGEKRTNDAPTPKPR